MVSKLLGDQFLFYISCLDVRDVIIEVLRVLHLAFIDSNKFLGVHF